jgi:hypothetical protein
MKKLDRTKVVTLSVLYTVVCLLIACIAYSNTAHAQERFSQSIRRLSCPR